jgi:hypothetical protein
MRHSAEYAAFTKVVDAVLSVSREEMKLREAAYSLRKLPDYGITLDGASIFFARF